MNPPDDKRPVIINVSQGKRIASAVRKVEGGAIPPRAQGARVVPFNPGVVRANVTTAVPTGTFAAPSNAGRAQISHKDHTGSFAASGDPVEVNNDHTFPTSIAVGKVVKLAWIDGGWWLLSADC